MIEIVAKLLLRNLWSLVSVYFGRNLYAKCVFDSAFNFVMYIPIFSFKFLSFSQ